MSSGWTASGRTTNERAQNLDGTLSETRGAARSLPARWRDLPRFHPDAAGPQPKPDNTPVASQATQAKSYSFKEDIQPLSRTEATPSPRESDKVARATPTPKPPPPIPQTIFATREQSVSEWFLPYGRLLRCELVNTVDSTNIDTPIIGLVIEDAWNDGRVIIPAGTEVHGVAQKSPVRERIGSDRQWFLVFQDGRELPISGTVLDYAPDRRIRIRGRNRTAPQACADSS